MPSDIENYECDCCKRRTIATQHEEISLYPKFLVIVLCREIRIAEGNTNNIKTVNTAVEFPMEDLCFPTVSNVQEQLAVVNLSYNLIDTVNHKAKTSSGHYTAVTKNANDWHCYNDGMYLS